MRSVFKLAGILPVAAAPFTEKGKLNYDEVESVVDFQIKAGAQGITLFGFATEFYKLAEAEKLQMLIVAKRAAGNRIPIITSVTEQATELAVWKAREMQDNGADALMVLPPFLFPAGQEAFVNHVRAVAEAVQIPVMIQYSPVETGVAIDASIFAELMDSNDNLQYLKIECKPPGPMISAVLAQERSSIGIFVGYAGLQMIDALQRGAIGVMPGSSFTDVYCRIYDYYRVGQVKEAMGLHNKLTPFLNIIFQSIEMIIKWEKVILKRRGIIASDYCRYPSFQPDLKAWELFEDYYAVLSKEFSI